MTRMRKMLLASALAYPLFGLTSCHGIKDNMNYVPPAIILPPDIKSISVRPFENTTGIAGIENKLWLATTDEFIRDGRITYVDSEQKSDGVVIGTIRQYTLTPLSQDVNLVPREYQMWVVMDLKFLDRNKHQYLWEEPNLEEKLRYFTETQPGGETEDQAREEIWDRFSKDIVRRTIEGFGSVTGSSSKAVPKAPAPENPPPQYPSTAPY